MTLDELKIEEKELHKQFSAINDAINANRRKQGALYIEQFKAENGLDIGDDVMENKKKFRIVDFEYQYGYVYIIGSPYKKDGTIGVRRATLYYPERIAVINQ